MKKSTFLFLLLLSSNLIFSQNSNTNLSKNCFDPGQIEELFKGIKQNEFLKKKLSSADDTIENANTLINSQKKTILKFEEESVAKDKLQSQTEALHLADIQVYQTNLKMLEESLQFEKKKSKIEKRQQFWKGFKIGGISVGVVGAAAAIYLISR